VFHVPKIQEWSSGRQSHGVFARYLHTGSLKHIGGLSAMVEVHVNDVARLVRGYGNETFHARRSGEIRALRFHTLWRIAWRLGEQACSDLHAEPQDANQ